MFRFDSRVFKVTSSLDLKINLPQQAFVRIICPLPTIHNWFRPAGKLTVRQLLGPHQACAGLQIGMGDTTGTGTNKNQPETGPQINNTIAYMKIRSHETLVLSSINFGIGFESGNIFKPANTIEFAKKRKQHEKNNVTECSSPINLRSDLYKEEIFRISASPRIKKSLPKIS